MNAERQMRRIEDRRSKIEEDRAIFNSRSSILDTNGA